jgi:hypothetical protein
MTPALPDGPGISFCDHGKPESCWLLLPTDGLVALMIDLMVLALIRLVLLV